MKMKPTRFAGWVRKNLADSLPTRRRAATTTHAASDGRLKHVARIRAPAGRVKRRIARRMASSASFLHRGWGSVHPFSGAKTFPREGHEQTGAKAGDDAMGCFLGESA